jgi:hypothetical protein
LSNTSLRWPARNTPNQNPNEEKEVEIMNAEKVLRAVIASAAIALATSLAEEMAKLNKIRS